MLRTVILVFLLSMRILAGRTMLSDDLFEKYNPEARPNVKRSDSVDVNVVFNLLALVELQAKTQMLTVMGWFDVFWTDKRLSWNITQYGADHLVVTSSKIWLPDVVIMNTEHKFGQLEENPSRVIIYPNGAIHWLPGGRYSVFCQINIKYFPFDTQFCHISVATWIGDIDNIVVTGNRSAYTGNDIDSHPQWALEVLSISAKNMLNNHNYNTTHFCFKLTRKYMFHIFNSILPTVVLSFLTNFSFILPAESGEKVTLSISVLLSYIVLLTYITGVLPDNSDQVSIFGVYLMVLLIISGLSTLVTVVVLHLHHKDTQMIPTANSSEEMENQVSFAKRPSPAQLLNKLAQKFFVVSTIFVNVTVFGLLSYGDNKQ